MMIRALSVYIYNNNNILTFWFLCQCVILLLLIMSVRRTRDSDVPENNNNDDDARRQRPRIGFAVPADPAIARLQGLLINSENQEAVVGFIEQLNATRNVTEVTALFNAAIDPVDLLDTRDAWRVQLYLRQRSVTKVPLVHAVFATRTPSEESIQLLYETAEHEDILLPWGAADASGFAPLHKACCATEVRALLRAHHGVSINVCDAFAHTALAHADIPEIARALLAAGAGMDDADMALAADIRHALRAAAASLALLLVADEPSDDLSQSPARIVAAYIEGRLDDGDAAALRLDSTLMRILNERRERWSADARVAHIALRESRNRRRALRAQRGI